MLDEMSEYEAIHLKENMEQIIEGKREERILELIPTVENTWRMLFNLFTRAGLEEYIPKLKERYI